MAAGMDIIARGMAGSKADLVNGKVPASQLPSYVDDIIEGYYYDGKFYSDKSHTKEIKGESGKIYIDLATNTSYRWSGSTFIPTEVTWGKINGNIDDQLDLKDKLDTLNTSIINETNSRIESETLINTKIDNESLRATEKETAISNLLNNEIEDRKNADINLSGLITQEKNRATEKENSIETKLQEEAQTRSNNDATLLENIDSETIARKNADDEINNKIDVLNTNITTEATTRENADKVINERIDNIESEKLPEISGNMLLCNGVAVRIEDDGTQNVAHYFTVNNDEKTIAFPYNYAIYGGGKGTSSKVANYDSTMVVINGGKFHALYGGSLDYGTVGVATLIVNGGTFRSGVVGGGYAGNKYDNNTVGTVNMEVNGGSSMLLFASGHGYGTVGNVNFKLNGGTYDYVTVGGSNGVTGIAKAIINGGTVKVFQTVNRGYVNDVEVEINGGNITKLYAGGETGDSGVTGKAEKVYLDINASFGGTLNKGTYGGVEDASRCSGRYYENTVTESEALSCNLIKKLHSVEEVNVNGASVVTDKVANINVPTKTSEITNDSNFAIDANYVHTDNNFTDTYKSNIETNNSKISNVQSDWNATEGLSVILNKPTDLCKKIRLETDGMEITLNGVVQTFNDIKNLISNENYCVFLTNDNYLFIPEYTNSTQDKIWFMSSTIYEDVPYLYCVTINTSNEVTSDEYALQSILSKTQLASVNSGATKDKIDSIANKLTDVKVDGTTVVTNNIANIDLTGKQDNLTAGTGIKIENNVISINDDGGIAIYDERISDANNWVTNGYTKTSANIPTANLPSVCTGKDRWGVLLYVAENNDNKAGMQQYFPIDGTYKGRIFYRSVTGGSTPVFGDWNIVPWSYEKQDTLIAGDNIAIAADDKTISATDTKYTVTLDI